MDYCEDASIYRRLWHSLEKASLKDKYVLAGFDGYVDSPVNPIDPKGAFFDTIGAFSAAIQAYGCESMDIPVTSNGTRMGGNGPLAALSLAEKGAQVVCIGALGVPLDETFAPLYEKTLVYSLAPPARCYALEFSDGKLMFGDIKALEQLDHAKVCDVVGRVRYSALVLKSDCIVFANWSALPHAENLLQGIIEALEEEDACKDKLFFIDLADPSGRSADDFNRLFDHMRVISERRSVVLSVNAKEAALVLKHMGEKMHSSGSTLPEDAAERLGIAAFVLHTRGMAIASQSEGNSIIVRTSILRQPAAITGSGDNFGAGFCAGHMLKLPIEQCVALGNISSYLFVKNGRAANLSEIRDKAGCWGGVQETLNGSEV